MGGNPRCPSPFGLFVGPLFIGDFGLGSARLTNLEHFDACFELVPFV